VIATDLARTLAALVASVAVFAGCASHASAPNDATVAPAVKTARVRIGSVETTLVAAGRVGPPAGSDAKLAFPTAGIVAEVVVRPGDRVTAGEPLAALDRRALDDDLAQARADASAATATYARGSSASAAETSARDKDDAARARFDALRRGGAAAQSDRIAARALAQQAALKVDLDRRALDRETVLYAGGVAAAKDVEAARSLLASDIADRQSADAKAAAATAGFAATVRSAAADAAQARSDLASARAAVGTARAERDAALAKLASAETDVARAVLRAPSTGIVVSVLKHPGEAVDPTTPVVDVVPPERGEVTLAIPSDDAARVVAGDVVRLAFRGVTSSARAHVAAVVPAVDSTTQAVTVVVRGDVPQRTVAGEAVEATIVLGRTSGIVVPSSAIVTDPETARSVVFVRDRASKATPYISRDVVVRASGAGSAVVSGLRAGDEIAIDGAYDLLAPGGS
jgi:multidrug efflux pump subunit AcrA (membrane-fusion protein)